MKVVLLSIPILLLFFCGIYRHDVPKQAFSQLANEPQFDCVGQVYNLDKSIGSCVLIDNKHILSAAHVFKVYHKKGDTLIINGKSSIIKQGYSETGIPAAYSFVFNGKTYHASKIETHPAYYDSATKYECDIVLITLTDKIENIQPAVLNTETDELHSVAVGIGYGVSGKGIDHSDVKPRNEKIAGENMIDSIGEFTFNKEGTQLICDFDNPEDSTHNRIGGCKPLALEYMCGGGDSGGGFFRKKGNEWALIGICAHSQITVSTNTGYYGSIISYTRISVLYNWIMEQVHKNNTAIEAVLYNQYNR